MIYVIAILILLTQFEEMKLNYSERKGIISSHGSGVKSWLLIRVQRILRLIGLSRYSKSGRKL